MGLQKALNSDGWINPDASHGALHRQPHQNGGSAGAESACEAAGVGGDLTAGSTLKQIPLWTLSLCSLPCMGFSCCWFLCLRDRWPLPCPQAALLLLLRCSRDQEGNSYFPGAERGGRIQLISSCVAAPGACPSSPPHPWQSLAAFSLPFGIP